MTGGFYSQRAADQAFVEAALRRHPQAILHCGTHDRVPQSLRQVGSSEASSDYPCGLQFAEAR